VCAHTQIHCHPRERYISTGALKNERTSKREHPPGSCRAPRPQSEEVGSGFGSLKSQVSLPGPSGAPIVLSVLCVLLHLNLTRTGDNGGAFIIPTGHESHFLKLTCRQLIKSKYQLGLDCLSLQPGFTLG
jgi:hypothetical protein